MEFRHITTPEDKYFRKAFDLYQTSFPEHEQRQMGEQQAVLSHPSYHCDVIIDNESFAGIIFYWETPQYVYIEHFAIATDRRGNHIGSRCLNEFCRLHPLTILEIDPPVDTVSLKRKSFYQRLGFRENPYKHTHPAYRQQYAPHELVVMSFPREMTAQEYDDFYQYLKNEVMQPVTSLR